MKWSVNLCMGMLIGLISLSGIAGGPEPAHMPDVAMPKFDFFVPEPSDLALAHQSSHRSVQSSTKHAHIVKTHTRMVTVYPGSLKQNIVRLSQSYGWQHIIWLPNADYHWIGKVRVAANNLPDILRQILSDYPLQADFYMGNHVLVIEPRTLQS